MSPRRRELISTLGPTPHSAQSGSRQCSSRKVVDISALDKLHALYILQTANIAAMSRSLTQSLRTLPRVERCLHHTSRTYTALATQTSHDLPSKRQYHTARPRLASSTNPRTSHSKSRPCSRPFHTTPAHSALASTKSGVTRGPSMAVAMAQQREKQIELGEYPDDLGLVEGTFIKPRPGNRPSWRKDFGSRWLLEKRWLVTRLREVAA